ncbi:MAG: hypothetical protein WAW03_19760 [Anaerolineae bacterium]|jgi:hypothetical protein|uniref:hypothetical protein n=1 Tax=Candidatus Amarolinea dominans TaxID=3140696 RepID=UPI001D8F7321|nr:hypothetical protein [Anaerolineae bacterium]MBK7201473.1 hypothetical protein [Anaerolineae bacterium]MBK9230527.1 hypothetical protein [Anaerolineae bacterium]
MIAPKAEIIFPPKLIPHLRDLRGDEWRVLVDRVTPLSEMDPDSLAFSLLMIRLDGCLKCYAGSYKFMRGCQLCAVQTITQYKGSDSQLLKEYQRAQVDIDDYLSGRRRVFTESFADDGEADKLAA